MSKNTADFTQNYLISATLHTMNTVFRHCTDGASTDIKKDRNKYSKAYELADNRFEIQCSPIHSPLTDWARIVSWSYLESMYTMDKWLSTTNPKSQKGNHLIEINTGLSIAGSSGGEISTILYVHFRNSREGKSTSGVWNPRAPHPPNCRRFSCTFASNFMSKMQSQWSWWKIPRGHRDITSI